MTNTHFFEEAGFAISTEKYWLDIPMIHQYLSEESYWAQHIPMELVKKSIDHSLCFGVYQRGKQVGFARVITDQSTFAYLADVFILSPFRGQGLAKWLMEHIHQYPDLQGLRRWMLMTKDAHNLYTRFGWEPVPESHTGRIMQKHQPDIYQPPAGETSE